MTSASPFLLLVWFVRPNTTEERPESSSSPQHQQLLQLCPPHRFRSCNNTTQLLHNVVRSLLYPLSDLPKPVEINQLNKHTKQLRKPSTVTFITYILQNTMLAAEEKVVCVDCDKATQQKDLPSQSTASEGHPCAPVYTTVSKCMTQNNDQVSKCITEWANFQDCHEANRRK